MHTIQTDESTIHIVLDFWKNKNKKAKTKQEMLATAMQYNVVNDVYRSGDLQCDLFSHLNIVQNEVLFNFMKQWIGLGERVFVYVFLSVYLAVFAMLEIKKKEKMA